MKYTNSIYTRLLNQRLFMQDILVVYLVKTIKVIHFQQVIVHRWYLRSIMMHVVLVK